MFIESKNILIFNVYVKTHFFKKRSSHKTACCYSILTSKYF